MCFKNPKMDNQESIQEPPNQDLACSAQIYGAILRKLLEDIIQESEQDPPTQIHPLHRVSLHNSNHHIRL